MPTKLKKDKVANVLARMMEQVSQETHHAEESFAKTNPSNITDGSNNTAWLIREPNVAWLIREPNNGQTKNE